MSSAVFSGFLGTVGVLMPLQGCRKVTVVQSCGEDRAQDEPDFLDARRAHAPGPQVSHPLADVRRHDLVHPHRTEPRQDVLADLVRVRLSRGRLHHVMGQPLLGHVPVGRSACRAVDR